MKLNSFQLKIIAIVLMTLSHIEYHIGVSPYLYIGQAAFPIFAFLTAYGASMTSNIKNYVIRLLGFGTILQIPLFIMGETYINIFITLGLGVLAIHAYKNHLFTLLIPIFAFAFFTELDYGVYGVLIILSAYIINYNKLYYSFLIIVFQFIWIVILKEFSSYQWFAILSIPLILMYDFELGSKRFKYLFYVYYPLHIGIIYLISLYV